MKKIIVLILIFTASNLQPLYSQKIIDVDTGLLPGKIAHERNDSNKAIALNDLSREFFISGDLNKAKQFASEALQLSDNIDFSAGKIMAYKCIADIFFDEGYFHEASKNYFLAIRAAEGVETLPIMADIYTHIGIINIYQGNTSQAMQNFISSLKINEHFKNKSNIARDYINMGWYFAEMHNNREALKMSFEGLKRADEINDMPNMAMANNNIGFLYKQSGDYSGAMHYLQQALKIAEKAHDNKVKAETYESIGETYFEMGEYSQAILTLSNALTATNPVNLKVASEGYAALSRVYEKLNDKTNAYKNFKLHIQYRDSLLNIKNSKELLESQMQFEFEKKESLANAEREKKDAIASAEIQRQKAINYAVAGGLAVMLVLAFGLYARFRDKKKANIILKNTLHDLRSTQAQLVKSEKLAAFGVMASRVAHEIQNPLNFVNNFSQLSSSLVDEILGSTSQLEKEEASQSLILNLQKINEHGNQASSIVKQLLDHSRAGTAQEFFEDNFN